jgi:hypothetical protein
MTWETAAPHSSSSIQLRGLIRSVTTGVSLSAAK